MKWDQSCSYICWEHDAARKILCDEVAQSSVTSYNLQPPLDSIEYILQITNQNDNKRRQKDQSVKSELVQESYGSKDLIILLIPNSKLPFVQYLQRSLVLSCAGP